MHYFYYCSFLIIDDTSLISPFSSSFDLGKYTLYYRSHYVRHIVTSLSSVVNFKFYLIESLITLMGFVPTGFTITFI